MVTSGQATTRLSNATRDIASTHLCGVLDNLYRYAAFPIKDPDLVVKLWNDLLPPALIHSIRELKEYGISAGSGAVGVDMMYDHSIVRIRTDKIAPQSGSRWGLISINETMIQKDPDKYAKMYMRDDTHRYYRGLKIDDAHLFKVLGDELANEFIEWVKVAGSITLEMENALNVIDDIFGMIKTAGQLKRMCPDLMRYLPDSKRAAFDAQKRASSIPFEWTPYPKQNVEDMIATLGKAYLLDGLCAPERKRLEWSRREEECWSEPIKGIAD